MKFHSKPIVEHDEAPLADQGRLDEIITHWQQRNSSFANSSTSDKSDYKANNCYVISVSFPTDAYSERKLAEILGLVKAQGDCALGHEVCRINWVNPKTFLGSGLSKAIAARAFERGADMLVLDAALTPSQTRNLENMVGMPICDREAVILNVFLKHAKTRSARNQVEIAHLEYLRPRIRGLGLNMDQQAGGIMGGRGPGETASELMARRLDARLAELRSSSRRLSKAGICQRKSRSGCKRIALVGYTNAGKTSLMNALTSAGLSARNLLFETLDTTTRALDRRPNGDILLSDTVGFIRALPDRLLASFESTLAEVLDSDLLVIVADASEPEMEPQLHATEDLLVKLKTDSVPRIYLFNKSDKLASPLSDEQCRLLSHGHPSMMLSSFDKTAVESLRSMMINEVTNELHILDLFVPYKGVDVIRKIYATCRVLDLKSDSDGMSFTLEGEAKLLTQLKCESEEARR